MSILDENLAISTREAAARISTKNLLPFSLRTGVDLFSCGIDVGRLVHSTSSY